MKRHQAIVDLVNLHESVRVSDLAAKLDVSESTIRTDLETLDNEGLLIRIRGGAISRQAEKKARKDHPSHPECPEKL